MSGKIEISLELAEEISSVFTGLEKLGFRPECAERVRALLAAPVVERQPVAWIVTDMNGDSYFAYDKQTPNDKPLYTSPPAPVAVELLARIQSEGLLCYAPEIDAEVTACIDKVKELNQ